MKDKKEALTCIVYCRMVRATLAIATVLLLTGLVAQRAQAQNYTVVYDFTGGADGGGPFAGLIRDAAGNSYGTTEYGGDLSCFFGEGCGVVFKLDPAGNETVLYTFTGGPDGALPEAGVISDAAGNLYGTTSSGGDLSCNCGVVFKLDPAGDLTVLHTFTGGTDGANPLLGSLIMDSAGSLYGTAFGGGDLGCNSGYGCGVVFTLDTAGNETVVHSFTGGRDGAYPYAGLLRDGAGNLYGTTYQGGDRVCDKGCGVVFKLNPAGKEIVAHSFTGGADGANPWAGLIRDNAGNLYGTTYGILSSDAGTVFELDSAGHETVLYGFTGGADGAYPAAGLIRDTAGNLYGATYGGGAGGGVVFMVTPNGQEQVLHAFAPADGYNSYARLLPYKGSLYGTASGGGAYGFGVVFKLTPH
ncbi:MAG TPA: choice-of-anchor tandem repeat GloVer-containing protein [Terriglobia bacterium]